MSDKVSAVRLEKSPETNKTLWRKGGNMRSIIRIVAATILIVAGDERCQCCIPAVPPGPGASDHYRSFAVSLVDDTYC